MVFIALGEDFPNIEYHRFKHKAAYLGMKNLWALEFSKTRQLGIYHLHIVNPGMENR